jgi:hypothetical protein
MPEPSESDWDFLCRQAEDHVRSAKGEPGDLSPLVVDITPEFITRAQAHFGPEWEVSGELPPKPFHPDHPFVHGCLRFRRRQPEPTPQPTAA